MMVPILLGYLNGVFTTYEVFYTIQGKESNLRLASNLYMVDKLKKCEIVASF